VPSGRSGSMVGRRRLLSAAVWQCADRRRPTVPSVARLFRA
jgi:hypothetical protein